MSFASLHRTELKLGLKLAGILALRMLGLFLVLPVFMVLAAEVPGYTPALAGLAIGIYGLTQAVLQQPVGWLSDHWGRRRVMLLGLGVFAAGGVVAAMAPSMLWLIIGRGLQGCGAIAGVALAFAADHTRPEKRSLIMAMPVLHRHRPQSLDLLERRARGDRQDEDQEGDQPESQDQWH